jgi:hypothetical protein
MSNPRVVERLRELENDGRLQPADVVTDGRDMVGPGSACYGGHGRVWHGVSRSG